MFLKFTTAAFAATFVNAVGDIKIPGVLALNDEPAKPAEPELLDQTKIASCVVNKQDTAYEH